MFAQSYFLFPEEANGGQWPNLLQYVLGFMSFTPARSFFTGSGKYTANNDQSDYCMRTIKTLPTYQVPAMDQVLC